MSGMTRSYRLNSFHRLTLSWRLVQLAWHLLSGLFQCAVLFPLVSMQQRSRLVQRWSRQLIRIFRVTLDVTGPVGAHGVVVSNHVSWIDVFVLNAILPCRFLAKSEVRRWPVLGWLSMRAGTLYIAREQRADLIRANAAIAYHLAKGERLAIFPEGTTARQGGVLPFHANLFQGIVRSNAAVLPVAIAYLDEAGTTSTAAEYIDDVSLWESILSLLSNGPLIASLAFLPVLAASDFDRRTLAAATHDAIAERLAQLP